MSSYRDLLTRADAPRASAWRLFGDDDELGTVNHLTRECVLEGVKCVQSGDTVGLDYPINAFDAPLARTRRTVLHHIFQRHPNHRDEYVDRLYPQSSSHIDGHGTGDMSNSVSITALRTMRFERTPLGWG